MNPIITPARRVANIRRNTTLPQYLHLPINAPRREKINPAIVIGVVLASTLASFAIIAIIINCA